MAMKIGKNDLCKLFYDSKGSSVQTTWRDGYTRNPLSDHTEGWGAAVVS